MSGAVFDHWCTFHRVPRAPPACRLPSCWCRATRVKFTAASSTPTEPRLPPPDSTDSYVSYNQLTLAQSCSLHIAVKTFILLNTFLKACFFPAVMWNVYGECENFATLKGHSGAVMELHYNTDGRCGHRKQGNQIRLKKLYWDDFEKIWNCWFIDKESQNFETFVVI